MKTTMTPAQCRAARGLLELTQAEFAEAANLSPETLRDFEAGRGPQNRSQVKAIVATIKSAGIEVTGEGVRWALPPLAPESSYHIRGPRLVAWPESLGGDGGAVDNPERAAANRARLARKGAPEPDPLSPDFISAARRTRTGRR